MVALTNVIRVEVNMPKYQWRCLACGIANSQNAEECESCGASSTPTAWELDAREFAIKHLLGGGCKPVCPKCENISHKIQFSEDPFLYFESRQRPLLRAMYVYTSCNGCHVQASQEYAVPSMRKIYRWFTGKDITNQRFLKI